MADPEPPNNDVVVFNINPCLSYVENLEANGINVEAFLEEWDQLCAENIVESYLRIKSTEEAAQRGGYRKKKAGKRERTTRSQDMEAAAGAPASAPASPSSSSSSSSSLLTGPLSSLSSAPAPAPAPASTAARGAVAVVSSTPLPKFASITAPNDVQPAETTAIKTINEILLLVRTNPKISSGKVNEYIQQVTGYSNLPNLLRLSSEFDRVRSDLMILHFQLEEQERIQRDTENASKYQQSLETARDIMKTIQGEIEQAQADGSLTPELLDEQIERMSQVIEDADPDPTSAFRVRSNQNIRSLKIFSDALKKKIKKSVEKATASRNYTLGMTVLTLVGGGTAIYAVSQNTDMLVAPYEWTMETMGCPIRRSAWAPADAKCQNIMLALALAGLAVGVAVVGSVKTTIGTMVPNAVQAYLLNPKEEGAEEAANAQVAVAMGAINNLVNGFDKVIDTYVSKLTTLVESSYAYQKTLQTGPGILSLLGTVAAATATGAAAGSAAGGIGAVPGAALGALGGLTQAAAIATDTENKAAADAISVLTGKPAAKIREVAPDVLKSFNDVFASVQAVAREKTAQTLKNEVSAGVTFLSKNLSGLRTEALTIETPALKDNVMKKIETLQTKISGVVSSISNAQTVDALEGIKQTDFVISNQELDVLKVVIAHAKNAELKAKELLEGEKSNAAKGGMKGGAQRALTAEEQMLLDMFLIQQVFPLEVLLKVRQMLETESLPESASAPTATGGRTYRRGTKSRRRRTYRN